MMAAKKNRVLHQLKVTLQRIQPPIWRRILVWEDATLAQLHCVLQIVMGWEDYHLHEFVIGRRVYSMPDPEDKLYERRVFDERRVRLGRVVPRVGTRFEYLYDFGDGWRHDLLLEAILLPDPETLYPRCLAGERCGPPEDAGGPNGYGNYLEALADPGHEEHENLLQWRGPFDPEAFSLPAVNQQLQEKFRLVPRTPTKQVPPPDNSAPDRSLDPALLLSLWARAGRTPKARKRIRPDDKITLNLNDRERELILEHSFADEELLGRLRTAPSADKAPAYHFTLDELEDLAGDVAAEANHAKNNKLRKEWERLYDRLADVLESYAHEDD